MEEDNSGLSLSPSKPGKHVESEMTRTMSQLLSSPVIFGGGEGVLQVDYNGLMVAFSMSGKKELWRYNFGTTMADRRQPAMTRNGEILIGAQNTILAIGGQGGCMMGYKTHDVYDMNEVRGACRPRSLSPLLSSPDYVAHSALVPSLTRVTPTAARLPPLPPRPSPTTSARSAARAT